ncbi:ATP-grasp domain-containing protein, partial [uncultured Actinomyces sp.]|uniref:ATP-grasp domain-containing protein n=1 Tax=uncultured Actinomyces sp. TaxID=249061 RepID=UPI0028D08C59
MSAPILAVVGGGQLARMMQEEASALGVHLRALVEAPDGSTAQVVVDGPVGAADDAAAVRALVEGRSAPAGGGADPGAAGLQGVGRADVLTFEHEHQDSALLERLAAEGVSVQPGPRALTLARDKLAMRRAMDSVGLPQPAWAEVGGDERAIAGGIEDFAAGHGWPVVLKTPRGGYDGHGVLMLEGPRDLVDGEAAAWVADVAAARAGRACPAAGGGGSLGGGVVGSLLVEQAVPFTRELAVLLARSPSGRVRAWPVAQTVQEAGICSEVLAPAPGLEEADAARAELIGRTVAERFDVTGVLAVELFAVEEAGRPTALYVNELAMRPHNSGHWTQDGAVTSQFAQHVRAVLDLPLGSPEPT